MIDIGILGHPSIFTTICFHSWNWQFGSIFRSIWSCLPRITQWTLLAGTCSVGQDPETALCSDWGSIENLSRAMPSPKHLRWSLSSLSSLSFPRSPANAWDKQSKIRTVFYITDHITLQVLELLKHWTALSYRRLGSCGVFLELELSRGKKRNKAKRGSEATKDWKPVSLLRQCNSSRSI